jgi:CubicO group peptidase (beta-lactamase class C family)
MTEVSHGLIAPGFERVGARFDEFLAEDPTFSAQLAARWRGELIVDLAGGPDLDADAVTGVFSVTKGISAVVLATLVGDGRLNLDAPVIEYWPEFAAGGKQHLLVRELLSHQSGLVNVDDVLTAEEFIDSSLAAARLAASVPVWRPGASFGYHGLTIGVFIEELIRRITGETLQAIYEREVRAPRNIDFYLGLPERESGRFRPVKPVVPTAAQLTEIAAMVPAVDGVMAFAFDSLHVGGMAVDEILPNDPRGRAAGFASVGGVGSARGMADVYAAAIGQLGDPVLTDEAITLMSQEQVFGIDRVLNAQMAFGVVFMKPQPRLPFASYRAFGHDGAGGALGFADPLYDLSFGYIPMPMQYPGGADTKSLELSLLIRQCISGLVRP